MEREPSGDGSVFPGPKAGVMLPLYMLCGQVRKGLTRRNSPFTDMLRTLSVLRGLQATPVEDLTEPHIALASQGNWRSCREGIDHSSLVLFKLPCQL